MPARVVLGQSEPTPEASRAVRKIYGEHRSGPEGLRAEDEGQVLQAATDLASARFIAFGTWKWTVADEDRRQAVYRYFTRVRPRTSACPASRRPRRPRPPRRRPRGAHSAEIQYAMGNLDLDNRYTWEADDRKVSETMQGYFVNFIKTGNPNGPALPSWPTYDTATNYRRMRIDVLSAAEPETDRARYQALDAVSVRQP
jgi:para-nitrobenzyl esterase